MLGKRKGSPVYPKLHNVYTILSEVQKNVKRIESKFILRNYFFLMRSYITVFFFLPKPKDCPKIVLQNVDYPAKEFFLL